MKEQPVKLGLIGIGVAAVIGGMVYDRFFKPVAPTGIEDITALLANLVGVVTILLGAFADIKKAIPPEAIADIEAMIKSGKLDVSTIAALISGKYKIDMTAIVTIIKDTVDKLKGGVKPPPTPTPGPDVPPDDNKPDDEIGIRQKLIEILSRFRKGKLKADVVLGTSTLKIEVDTPATTPVTEVAK